MATHPKSKHFHTSESELILETENRKYWLTKYIDEYNDWCYSLGTEYLDLEWLDEVLYCGRWRDKEKAIAYIKSLVL
jgi:hypothetical protein